MLKSVMNYIKSVFIPRELATEEGQGTIEYILVLGVIVVGIFGLVAWTDLGTAISGALAAVTGLFSSSPIG